MQRLGLHDKQSGKDAMSETTDADKALDRLHWEWAERTDACVSTIRHRPEQASSAQYPHGMWGEKFTVSFLGPRLPGSVKGQVTVSRLSDPGVFQVELLGDVTVSDGNHSYDPAPAIATLSDKLPGVILDWRQDEDVLALTYDARPRLQPEDRLYAYWAVLGEYVLHHLKQNKSTFGKPNSFGVVHIPYHVDLGHEAAVGRLTVRLESHDTFMFTFTAECYPQLDYGKAKTRLHHHFPAAYTESATNGVTMFIEL